MEIQFAIVRSENRAINNSVDNSPRYMKINFRFIRWLYLLFIIQKMCHLHKSLSFNNLSISIQLIVCAYTHKISAQSHTQHMRFIHIFAPGI